MRRIGNANRRQRTIHLAVAAAASAALAAATFTAPASAAVSCSQAGTTVTVTMSADGDQATFLRGLGRKLLVNGLQCGTATTDNTQKVVVTGGPGEQTVIIELAGGPFVSLQRETSPPSGTSVQFQVDLGEDWGDDLFLSGTTGAETVVAGTNGITLDQASPAGELDVIAAGVDMLDLRGRGGNDFLSSAGDNTTGAAVTRWVTVMLWGEQANDTLVGGDYATLFPGPGDDAMAGQDRTGVSFLGAPGPVTVDLAAGTATGEGNDTLSSITGVWGSDYADKLTGDDGVNSLFGRGGSDVIRGAGGDDALMGNEGDDDVDGESGSDFYRDEYYNFTDFDAITDSGAGAGEVDTVNFDGSTGPVAVDLAAGTATGGGADTLAGIEKVYGTAFADTLLGASGIETLLGEGGDDLIRPRGGNDSIDGGSGVDTLAFDQAPKGVSVSLSAGTASGEGADTFAGIERVRGSAFADVLRGSGAVEALFGLGGADTLVGGGGADRLDGGSGRDTANYATASSAVTVDLARRKASRGAGADTLFGLENVVGSRYADLLVGSRAANVLRGGSGRDTLKGGARSDRLYGMSASDALYGAGGNDLLSGSTGARDRCSQGGGTGRRIGCELR